MASMHSIYDHRGKVTANRLRGELHTIADMVEPGASLGPVLQRLELLAIELHMYNEKHRASQHSQIHEPEVSRA